MMSGFFRALVWVLLATATTGFSQDRYTQLQRQGAQYYSEQSYAEAHRAWSEAAKLDVPEGDRHTLDFYLADSLWRSKPDAAGVEEAREQLATLSGEGRPGDVLAAEAAESLGDSWLALEGDWERAWAEYQRALGYWAATDDAQASGRWLGILWKATGPPTEDRADRRIPLDVLEHALRIAPSAEEQARAHFFLGRWFAEGSDAEARERAGREFQAAVDAGRDTAVYDAALFRLAEWMLATGSTATLPDGRIELRPDYARALELFQRFVSEFPKGSSPFVDAARRQIDALTRPSLALSAEGPVLPGVKPRLKAGWCNVAEVKLTLARVELARDFQPDGRTDPDKWLDGIHVPAGANARQWTEANAGAAPHAPIERTITLDALDQPGTYLVEARAGGLWARALVVVTAKAAIYQEIGARAVAFLCDARTGVRATEGSVKMWQVEWRDNQWRWAAVEDAARDGLARVDLPAPVGRLFVFAKAEGQPAGAHAMNAGSGGEKSGDASSGDGNARNVSAELTVSRPITTPGKIVKLSLETHRGGDRVAASGTLVISRLRWNAARGKYASEEIARDSLATNASGSGGYLFRPGAEGFYRVEWSGAGNGGASVVAEIFVWSGAAVGWHPQGVEMVANPAGTEPEGGASVLVGGAPGSDVVLLAQAGGQLLRAEAMHLSSGARVVKLEGAPHGGADVLVTVAGMRDGRLFTETRKLGVAR
jgi:tetratricopeptide (TPR) repeat protein